MIENVKLNERTLLPRSHEPRQRLAKIVVLSHVHHVFHVSMLRKCATDPTHVIDYIPLEIQPDLTYEEKPVKILDHKTQVLRTKTVRLLKILWRNSTSKEAT